MRAPRHPLIDRFGRRHNYLRISITDRCNFRCAYCMPDEEMVWKDRAEILTFEEIQRLAELFAELGVDKIRLTGGEPTVRKGLVDFVGRLKSIPEINELTLTTNGATLATTAQTLAEAGLTGINISLDTLRPERFLEITRRDRLASVLAGIDEALKAGFAKLKINVVAMADVNDDELTDFVERFWNDPIHIRFIEFMPFQSNGWEKARMIPYSEMRAALESRYRLIPLEPEPSAVAKEFAVEGARVQVGFITSMTDDFCGGCNRLRLTADGKLKVCLFAPTGPSLRDAMRSGADDDQLADIIRNALAGKWAGHPPMQHLVRVNDLPMISIGG
ncbi:MAG: GTP 3',8-cyclase MoaA [Fimbriimonadaceae bacterium]|nr:GTP 3',8-cyclase MoaA [Fimbriimonadaceae bacterium]